MALLRQFGLEVLVSHPSGSDVQTPGNGGTEERAQEQGDGFGS